MGYRLSPRNKSVGDFDMGAWHWLHLIEQIGFLFPLAHDGGRWYCVFGADERMGEDYPLLQSNDGFPVTAEEARIMARMARNYVAVQRSLDGPMRTEFPWLKDEWPKKIRTDFVDKFEAFAEWAERSSGFRIF